MRKLKGVQSPNRAVDPERSAAMKGNSNAKKAGAAKPAVQRDPNSAWGARAGALGSLAFGAPGAFAAGAIIGAAKRGEAGERAHKRVVRASAITGAVSGALVGGIVGGATGMKNGLIVGAGTAAAFAGLAGGAAKLGNYVGKGMSNNQRRKKK